MNAKQIPFCSFCYAAILREEYYCSWCEQHESDDYVWCSVKCMEHSHPEPDYDWDDEALEGD